jgi:diguanylate cyclase (GGDEF)-like protein/PAS domain S-box-containing protein
MRHDRRGSRGLTVSWAAVVVPLLLLAGALALFIVPSGSAHGFAVRTSLLVLCAGLASALLVFTRRVDRDRAALYRREQILQAVSRVTECLSRPAPREETRRAAAHLAEVFGAARGRVFENRMREDGELCLEPGFEWSGTTLARSLIPQGNMIPYLPTYERWRDAMPQGRVFVDDRTQWSGGDDVRCSTLFVPIGAKEQWWGVLAVEADDDVTWGRADVELWLIVASHAGATLATTQTRRELERSESRFRSLVEHIPAITYIDHVERRGPTVYMSPQIEELLGTKPEEWMRDDDGMMWDRMVHPDDRAHVADLTMRHYRTGEPFQLDYRMIARDGRTVWVRDHAVIVPDADGNPLYSQGVAQDITAQKEAEQELAFLAYHDGRTRLPNRAMFEELLELSVDRARRHDTAAAVLCLNVDDFGLVNESLGHNAADEVLMLLADRLRKATRETDLVARVVGDQFLLLLSDLERSEGRTSSHDVAIATAESVADRVHESLRAPFDLGETEVYLSASIGISLFPHHAGNSDELLKRAEQAMHESRKSGPGGVLTCTSAASSGTRLTEVTRLRRAVGDEPWVLHYQPLVRLETAEVLGVEALIRWREHDGSLVPPTVFIPLAEELGLMDTIGDWVAEEVARQHEVWRKEGIDMQVSFNVSPRQAAQLDLADRIVSRLAAHDVDPGFVIVELTESRVQSDFESWRSLLVSLRERGVHLALDDFGTEYSSMSRLRELPFDALKIDRSFVHGVHKDPQAAGVVGAIIELARGLEMETVAEGIETEEDRQFLIAQGCRTGQGFLFSEPVPAEVISRKLREGELVLASGRGPLKPGPDRRLPVHPPATHRVPTAANAARSVPGEG